MLLILTNAHDSHADAVIERLQQRDVPFFRCEPETFPSETALSLQYEDGRVIKTLRNSDRVIDLDEVTCVWNRRPHKPRAASHLDANDTEFVNEECLHFIRGLWHLLEDRPWINPHVANIRAHYKPLQLSIASKLGLTIPRTVITNHPETALAFVESCPEGVIYKPMTFSHFRLIGDDAQAIFTSLVDPRTFADNLEAVRQAPVLMQEHVKKADELRITVMNGSATAVAIDSQKERRTEVDWRRVGLDVYDMPHRETTLPPSVERQLLTLVEELGLVFGCIDMIRKPDGQLVFLEINPNGQWLWLELVTHVPLVEKFVDWIVALMSNARVKEARVG